MTLWTKLAPCTTLLLLAAPATAQDYWEQETWSGEWEYHEPLEGQKTTYDWDWDEGWVVEEVEQQEYEWEPGEGYHEEEWYDPSDWFDATAGVDYDYDWNTWGYDYDYGLGYEPYDYDYFDADYGYTEYDYGDDYGYDWDPLDYGYYDYWGDRYGAAGAGDYGYDDLTTYDGFDYDYDYAANRPGQQRQQMGQQRQQQQQMGQQQQRQRRRGEVVGLRRIRGASYGEPDQVVLDLRTQDGRVRSVTLGDVGYVTQYLPTLQQGERVAVGGRQVDVNGRQLFKVEEIRSRDSAFDIPEYEYRRTLRGQLVGLRQVKTRNGDVTAVVARLRDPQGNTRDLLLGEADALRGRMGTSIRPNAQVQVEGYRRSVDGRDAFVVQNVRVLDEAQQRMQPARAQRGQQTQTQQATQQRPMQRSQMQGQMRGQQQGMQGMGMQSRGMQDRGMQGMQGQGMQGQGTQGGGY